MQLIAKARFISDKIFSILFSLTLGCTAAKPLKFHTVQFKPPTWCVPIRADVTDFDFTALADATQFDVIHMDPPWQLASATPTRGV